MKLFIWNRPYRISYGDSSYIAVAETAEEARELAKRAKTYRYCIYEQKDKGALSESVSIELLREPDRVVDLPCAEFHEWEE